MPSEPSVDRLQQWLSEVADGREAALSRLYDHVSRRVYGLALRILGDEHAAEEATLETFIDVWNRSARYEPSKGSVQTWILMIARSRSIDALRKRQRHAYREVDIDDFFSLPDPGRTPEQESLDRERGRRVREALDALPPEQREAVTAAFFGSLSHSEVAQLLEQPLGTVKTRIRSGLERLRRTLASAEEGLL